MSIDITELCEKLSARGASLDDPRQAPSALWPREQLQWLADAGILRGMESTEHGGWGWSDAEQLQVYLDLSAACLTTAFVLTQYAGAVRRLLTGAKPTWRNELSPGLLSGADFATVAISHLTTSRRHLTRPCLIAEPIAEGWILSGHAPWVTGASFARWITTAAVQPNGQQVLLAVSGEDPGLQPLPCEELLALTASCTGSVEFHDLLIPREQLLAGPADNIMANATGAKTGGLTTSALAIGHATGPIQFLQREAEQRPDLKPIADELARTQQELRHQLLQLATGVEVCTSSDLRVQANSLAIRAAQAALGAAKGAGYIAGHPTSRWCRESLFFLVWSCPHSVVTANLCEFAGLT